MSSSVFTIRLSREDNSVAWGFRLEGGVDVGHAINIQRVAPGSLADLYGLQAGDHVLRINQSDTKWMRHDDAKMEIIRSANDIEMLVQRGNAAHVVHSMAPITMSHSSMSHNSPNPTAGTPQTIWRPKVVSTIQMSGGSNRPISPTYTSLEASPQYQPNDSIGVKHNSTPTPFGHQPPAPGQTLVTQTSDGRFRRIGHSTYNSPMGLYNQHNMNQAFERTMSAATNSNHAAAQTTPRISGSGGHDTSSTSMYCGACGEFIRGVFVKVQGRVPMHPACLKCCKCGVGLRNVGYFYIKEQLYCETHAKQAAPPPEPGMRPVVVYK